KANMKRSAKPMPDIYLSCATCDRTQAETIVRQLARAGFAVRRISELEWQQAVAADRVETVWAALRTRAALVVLGTPTHTRPTILTTQVGGARAGPKPIYVLVEPDAADDLPSSLQRQHILPLSELDHLVALLEAGASPPGPAARRLRSPRLKSSR